MMHRQLSNMLENPLFAAKNERKEIRNTKEEVEKCHIRINYQFI